MSAGPAAGAPRAPIATRAPLAGAVALVLFTLAATAVGHFTRHSQDPSAAPVVAERRLVFKDRADGAVLIFDADAPRNLLIQTVTGPSGFLRGVLRGFARARAAAGLGDEPAFRLVERTNGHLTLEDPSTGRSAELEAFGPDNAQTFARLLLRPPAN